MLILGLILLLVGWLAAIEVLIWLGLIVGVIGLALMFVKPGGRYYY